MGTENPNLPNYPFRPPATPLTALQSATPFLSSAASEGLAFRPPPNASPQFRPPPFSSGHFVGSETPTVRPLPQGRPNDVVRPLPPQSYAPSATGFQNFQNPPFSSIGQASARPFVQPSSTPSFPLQQGGYAPPGPPSPFLGQQRSYVPGPSITTPSGLYPGSQIQHQGIPPPTGTSQGLAEDFSSLSLGSGPGSLDAGLDAEGLPRPLDGDVEPKSFLEMYPLNCNCKFLRLTTSGIPNSQSLASRWHLPLGAVVCPLAEVPPEVSLYCTRDDRFANYVYL